ncbi:hypothetical protein C0J52_24582 [Blattella germanica]|nr:hypothetical protein C0J52_24582 [Blattella germanica]
MADTSLYSVEERLVVSVWAHERPHTGNTMEDVRQDFTRRFHKNAPPKMTILLGKETVFVGMYQRQTEAWCTSQTTETALGKETVFVGMYQRQTEAWCTSQTTEHMCRSGGICASVTTKVFKLLKSYGLLHHEISEELLDKVAIIQSLAFKEKIGFARVRIKSYVRKFSKISSIFRMMLENEERESGIGGSLKVPFIFKNYHLEFCPKRQFHNWVCPVKKIIGLLDSVICIDNCIFCLKCTTNNNLILGRFVTYNDKDLFRVQLFKT